MLSLYFIQVTLGYVAMLVAMTYQVELFLAVVIGLTAGHGIFNLRARVAESADACCQGLDPGDEGDAMLGPKTVVNDDRDLLQSTASATAQCADASSLNGVQPLSHRVVHVTAAIPEDSPEPRGSCCHNHP
jgi:hypothetical protein